MRARGREVSGERIHALTLVLPWYGPEVPGGAERDARHLAEHLCAAGHPVEVWTTCAQHLGGDWNENYYRPGRNLINGVPVTRFPVTPMQRDRYWAIHRRLAQGGRVTPREEALFLTQSIRSRALCDQVRARHSAQPDHLFVFTPYLFGTTYWGAYAAPDRALLVPCLHDEGFARLVALRGLFQVVRGVLCNSTAEMQLVRRLYDVPPERLAVIGDGIDLKGQGDARVFRERFGITAPFILYVGRKSSGKNLPLLLNYFYRYRRRRQTGLELVLIGPGQVSVSQDSRQRTVHDLGFVTEEDKRHAFAAADVFCQPSVNESFSLVLMEAWVQGTPALVNARCAVTREHCQYSQGGLYFNGYQEFEATLDWLLSHPAARRQMGACGRRYVEQNYTWEKVMGRFVNAVQALGS